MQGMNSTESNEQRLADELDIRGPFIQNKELDEVLARNTEASNLHEFASGVLAARMVS